MTTTIFRIERAPGDAPRAVEQPNGDLLLPAQVRQVVAELLSKTEADVAADPAAALARLDQARRLLAIDPPHREPAVLRNLLKVRAI